MLKNIIICINNSDSLDEYNKQTSLGIPKYEEVINNVRDLAEKIFILKSSEFNINRKVKAISILEKDELKECLKFAGGTYGNSLFVEADADFIERELFDKLLNCIENQNVNCSILCSQEMRESNIKIKALACNETFLNKNIAYIDSCYNFLDKLANAAGDNLFKHIITTKKLSSTNKLPLNNIGNIAEYWKEKGVIFEDINKVQISETVLLEPGVYIGSFVVLDGNTYIEEGARVTEFSSLKNSVIGKNSIIKSSTIFDSHIGDNVEIGPYSYIRDETIIKDNALIGSFAEINNTVLGKYSRMKHFSYIGYSTVGEDVNIGAGVITCTFDGKDKHRTRIEDKAFIGCGSLMIAPVFIGKNAKSGAGSVITKQVKKNTQVYGVPAKEHK